VSGEATATPDDAGPQPVRVYTPESRLRSPGVFLRELLHDVGACRGLAWRLFLRDLRAQYRQTLFGYVWAFLPPLATTAVWVLLQRAQVANFDAPADVPYVVFVLTGTLLWQVFVDALNMPLRSTEASKAMLAKISFPREALLLAGALEVGFNLFLRALLLAGVFAWFGVGVHPSLALVPLGVLGLFLLGAGLGLLLTPLGLLYGDVRRGLFMLTQFWFYLTPVIYQAPQTGLGSWVNVVNPVAPLISASRDWLLVGATVHGQAFAAYAVAGALLVGLGIVLLRVAMPFLIERMSS
jgi:lipopolysaccharide transport system permease protein